MRTQLAVGLLCVSGIGAGCSKELQVHGLRQDQPRVGIGYVLPFTQYAINETWALDYCPDPQNPDPIRGTEPRIGIKVEATSSAADDGELAFVIDPQDLQTLTNVTAFAAKWHEGRNMLSTINASAEDRTTQIIGNLTKAVVKILPLAMGVPSAPTGPRVISPCTDQAVTDLAAAKTAKATLETANKLVESRAAEVNRLAAKVLQQATNVDEGTKKALGDAIDLLVQAKAAQAEAAEKFVKTLKPISHVRKFTWPSDGNTFSHGPDRLPGEVLQRWLKPAFVTTVHPRPVYLQIERTGSFGRVPSRLNLTPDAATVVLDVDERKSPVAPEAADNMYTLPSPRVAGLRYRMPAAGRLVACFRSPCGSTDPEGVIASFDGPVVQLGYVNVLPFRSRVLGNNSFSAEFGVDGSLKSVAYDQKAAPAEAATGAFADTAGQLADVLSPTARLTADNAYLKALKEKRDALEALKAKPETAEAAAKASLDSETALINAQIANLTAEIALEELRAKQTGGN